MKVNLPCLQWTQDGVVRMVKLLPDGRIGFLSKELAEEARCSGTVPNEKIAAIRRGDVQAVRRLQKPEGRELATTPLQSWEETVQSSAGSHPVTFLRPEGPAPAEGRPCILYFHGGGWQYGSREIVLPFCRYLAEQANAVVAVPEYHLAPEHRWPAGLEDCWALVCLVYQRAAELGVDPVRITVAGDSAGGNLAALCSHRDRDRRTGMIAGQILYYPALSVRDTEGMEDFRFDLSDYIYDDSQRDWIVPNIQAIWRASANSEKNYLPKGVTSRRADVSPLWDTDFAGLPPTLLITAQYDYLTSQAAAYSKKLARAGVPVTWVDYCGVGHAFVDRCGIYPQADDSLRLAAAFAARN
ncbi:alpha/beta hydrolase [Subdoligranulum variabile]|uniref:alpha/beta hydrolase n=1 Tax=Subdoligranulum variabile TaxID=214851 RepID=UPI002941CDD6|nr:alpha/beta hydrolase [Subdoligranulum variabile]